jgi:hypothetical protein
MKKRFAHRPLPKFESSQMCPRPSPPYPDGVGALAGGEVKPGEANKQGVRLDSRVAESQWWLGRRDVRRWPAARQWQHDRRGLGCDELLTKLSHQARLEAHVWAREGLRVAGWSRAQARRRAHRRR